MLNKILSQLSYLNDTKKDNLKTILNDDINANKFIQDNYNNIMSNWHKMYPMFDIPNGIIAISINEKNYYYNIGSKIYDSNTIFDIASETKIYTEFIMFSILDEYNLDLNTKVSDLTCNYVNIKDLTLMDLISFNNTYHTLTDIRECKNIIDAKKALRTAYIDKEKSNYYLYTDLPIMILTDILEEYTKMSYAELFDKYIIKKYNLNSTYLTIQNDVNYVTLNKNMVNDPKACIFNGFYGHCGVKTSCNDFLKFMNTVLNSKYAKLFITKTKTFNEDGSNCLNKALVGNSNLPVNNEKSLASNYLNDIGFAIQGSLRCHCETCKMIIDEKEYIITRCIFLDLYTQYNNAIEYEKVTEKKITKFFDTDNYKNLKMVDIRSILPYYNNGEFKKIVDVMSIASIINLYNELK